LVEAVGACGATLETAAAPVAASAIVIAELRGLQSHYSRPPNRDATALLTRSRHPAPKKVGDGPD